MAAIKKELIAVYFDTSDLAILTQKIEGIKKKNYKPNRSECVRLAIRNFDVDALPFCEDKGMTNYAFALSSSSTELIPIWFIYKQNKEEALEAAIEWAANNSSLIKNTKHALVQILPNGGIVFHDQLTKTELLGQ